MNEKGYETVDELSLRLKGVLVDSALFSRLVVKGEVSGKKEHSSGVYFDLKGERSLLSCVVWKDVYLRQKEPLEEGSEVLCRGGIDYYAPRGRLTFKVYSYEKEGEGAKDLALRALYRKLKDEGLFERPKKPFPKYPETLALVAGYRSAAASDVLRNVPRRWPLAKILLFPALVQGEKAPSSLLSALKAADASIAEAVILARGGGSTDDLMSFNDEAVVRQVASMKKPIVSAVGHEIDISLTDFAADLRASTPTAASELVTPEWKAVMEDLDSYEYTLDSLLRNKLSVLSEKISSLSERPFFKSPLGAYEVYGERLERLSDRLNASLARRLEQSSSRLSFLEGKLAAFDLRKTLKRGFAYLTGEDGRSIVRAGDAEEGRLIVAHLADGAIVSEVKEIKEDGKEKA